MTTYEKANDKIYKIYHYHDAWVGQSLQWYVGTGRAWSDWVEALGRAQMKSLVKALKPYNGSTTATIAAATLYFAEHRLYPEPAEPETIARAKRELAIYHDEYGAA